MKALILDGSNDNDQTGERVLSYLKSGLLSRGWDVEHIVLRDRKIGNCAGDFFCWIRSPGLCNINDDNRRIVRSATGSDLTIFLTPVTFGGYSSCLKRLVDHLTQNNLPFFKIISGEVHHFHRYAHTPKLLAIGWADNPKPEESAIFHHLVYRNALNMHFSTAVSRVIYDGQRDKALAKELSSALKNVESDHGLQGVELPCLPPSRIDRTKIRHALLLVGSPRGQKSTSQQLGGYLMRKLAERGISTETIQLYPVLGSRERIHSLLETIDASDLILLACPLYIDSLPGPVTRALEMIAIWSETTLSPGGNGRPAFAVIVNSGFPEAEQNQTALAICAQFAKESGFTWAGGLALGGGSSLIDGKPLDKLGWRGNSIRASLELSAMSLASGKPIPDEAVRMMAKKRVPKWMVLLFGPIKWILMARKYGAVLTMWRKPFLD